MHLLLWWINVPFPAMPADLTDNRINLQTVLHHFFARILVGDTNTAIVKGLEKIETNNNETRRRVYPPQKNLILGTPKGRVKPLSTKQR